MASEDRRAKGKTELGGGRKRKVFWMPKLSRKVYTCILNFKIPRVKHIDSIFLLGKNIYFAFKTNLTTLPSIFVQ